MLRSCYQSYMRLYPDDPDRLTLGRWRWCPEGADELPMPHAFGSAFLDPYPWQREYPLGEVRGHAGGSKGTSNPRFTGRNFCGAVQLWQEGSPLDLMGTPPVDGEGIPLCCKTAGPELGGAEADGEADFSSTTASGLWLRPEELTGYAPGSTMTTWARAPLTTRDGTSVGNAPLKCYLDPASNWKGGLFSCEVPTPGTFTQMEFPGLPVGDWTVLVVARTLYGGEHGPFVGSAGLFTSPLLVSENGVQAYAPGGFILEAPAARPRIGLLHFYGSMRYGDVWSLWRDGVLLADASGPTEEVELSRLHIVVGFSAPGQCWIPEIRIIQRALTLGELAAEFQYLDAKYRGTDEMLTGAIAYFAKATPREGWLLCDGSAYYESDFPALADYLGGDYDVYRGSSAPSAGQFRVPDLRGLALVGGGDPAINPTTSARTLGETGGEEEHVLTEDELAGHSHGLTDPGHQHPTADGGDFIQIGGATFRRPTTGGVQDLYNTAGTGTGYTDMTVDSAGGDDGHNNIQPYGVGFPFIKT